MAVVGKLRGSDHTSCGDLARSVGAAQLSGLLDPVRGWTPFATPDIVTVLGPYVAGRPTALLLDVRNGGTPPLEQERRAHVTVFDRFEDIDFTHFEVLVAVTWRRYEAPVPTLHLWARALCVGVGCTRGTSPEAFARSADAMLSAAGLAPAAVRVVATATRKRDEPALRLWAASLGASFATFDDATLAAQPTVAPAPHVHEAAGLPPVAEAAALAAADRSELLLARRKASLPLGHHHTLAVAVAANV
jgi:hypothetical protein